MIIAALKRIGAILIDTSLVIGLAAVVTLGTAEMINGPAELDTFERVALDARLAPVEARLQARADLLGQTERQMHASAAQPVRKRHQSVVAQGEQ